MNENFNILDFIDKKANKQEWSQQEIAHFVQLVHDKKIPDYQISACLMAIKIQGLNDLETYYLTDQMVKSGITLDLPKSSTPTIDKHSTGGVGDKVSLILLPILAACGLKVAKLSGKGLGYTGGTIDKLEGLNVKTNLNFNQAINQFEKDGFFLIQQTKDIAPVDKVLYALRDTSATVASIPLIASSVMSKKLALKTDYIFLDIKYGSGSFCPTLKSAKMLANAMIKIAKNANRKLYIHITSMQQPLGNAIGNLIELVEVQNFLNNQKVSPDLDFLIKDFAVYILLKTKWVKTKQEAKTKIEQVLSSKQALKKLENFMQINGGDLIKWNNQTYFNPKYKHEVYANQEGYFNIKSTQKLGIISGLLGAGRQKASDQLDYQAGIWIDVKINDKISKNQLLCTLYSSKPIDSKVIELVQDNFEINKEKVAVQPLVISYEK